MRSTGKMLRSFNFSECTTGSELRGVRRVQLLQVKRDAAQLGIVLYLSTLPGLTWMVYRL